MENLLTALRNREATAYRVLYTDAYPICASFIFKNGGKAEDAEDIFQEAVLHFLMKLEDHSFELSCKISTYLYAVVMRMWRHQSRKNSKMQMVQPENLALEELPDLEEADFEEDELLLEAMRILENFDKEDCKRILRQYYYYKASLTTIAEQEGYSVNYAKKKKANCLKYLRNAIEKAVNL
jgi:RNA polymerase sigma factor (sigma-70 family)